MAAKNLGEKEAARYNTGKCKLSLISPVAYWALGQVYHYGAGKYEDHNWRKGMNWSDMLNSLERHLMKFKMGEDLDEESGLPHAAFIAWNAMALLDYYFSHPEKDDRAPAYGKEVIEKLRKFDAVANEGIRRYKESTKSDSERGTEKIVREEQFNPTLDVQIGMPFVEEEKEQPSIVERAKKTTDDQAIKAMEFARTHVKRPTPIEPQKRVLIPEDE